VKSVITRTLIISFLIIFYPYYSYSYLGLDYNLEMKNNNSELLNKIIEPSINYVSLKNDDDIDFDDIDDLDIVCFENDDDIDFDDINDHNVIFLTDDN
ncbi:MAG TPA: hypothetical protein VFM28_07085, partial [Nitrososphaeraceae archaeon]|nr:hypothetical protein [Nitrososphaeraceae archaeon]